MVRATALVLAAGSALVGCRSAPNLALRYLVKDELTVEVPEGASRVRIWLALPQEGGDQRVSDLVLDAPVPAQAVVDSVGNRMLYLESDGSEGRVRVTTSFLLERVEVRGPLADDPGTDDPGTNGEDGRWLAPGRGVMIDDRVRRLAAQLSRGRPTTRDRARAIFDWMLDNADLWVKDPAHMSPSGEGSSLTCLTRGSGDDADLHALFTALARAAGIPARMVYGALLKAELDGLESDQGVHTWVEFLVQGSGWVSVDLALADLFEGDFVVHRKNGTLVRLATPDGYRGGQPERVEYYFGHLEPRRVRFSTGRDLGLSPPADAGPIDSLASAYVEVDGAPLRGGTGWTRRLTYREIR